MVVWCFCVFDFGGVLWLFGGLFPLFGEFFGQFSTDVGSFLDGFLVVVMF